MVVWGYSATMVNHMQIEWNMKWKLWLCSGYREEGSLMVLRVQCLKVVH